MRSRLIRVALLSAGAALTLVLAAATAPAKSPGGKLSKDEAALLRQARAEGKDSVVLLIAAQPGQAGTVAGGLQSLGATVGYRDDQLGYVRATVPLDKVEQAFALAGVQSADVDKTIPYEDPAPGGVSPIISQAPPGAATPRVNPYMPTQDTGAAQFVNAHPTWDGRGVTIGIVDTGVSFDNPAVNVTSTGERKIVDWVTGTDPLTDHDPTWINMKDQVSGASFTWSGATYTAPAAGSFRIGAFREDNPLFGGEFQVVAGPGGDLNRDGDQTDVFALLWNPTTDEVWVDTDGDRSFADESAMRNYVVKNDIGWLGTDNPATAVAERVPFVVQTDAKDNYVNLGIVAGLHATHVAGIAAGNRIYGGQASGAAPGAKIVSSRACLFVAGCTSHALFEGMIFVAKQRNVDVINMSIGGLPALNDGNNARCALYDRLIDQSKVQMFISQGNNGPGVNTAGDPGLCNKVLGLGAYISSDTYEKDYGTPMPFVDNLHFFSSRGPREDGGFAPELVTPGAAVSTTPMWQAGSGLPYTLPPGLQLQNGTSMAAPQATGVGALLVSAAKQVGIQYKPDQIRQALLSTARYLDPARFQAYDQGLGLIDIGKAWDLLKTNIKTVDITGTVPVNTLLSGFLAVPGVGTGIYDREGVTAGSTYTRTFTFTRNDGPGGTVNYNVGWVGNDGTFSAPSSILLAKGGSAQLTVTITPAAGAHSAILTLDDPSTTGLDYETMNTVIAPFTFSAPGYSQTISSDIARGQSKHYFFRVPTNTPAFKVDMTGGGGPGAGAIRFLRWHPWGLGIESNAVSNCYNGAPGGCNGTASPTSRTVTSPQAGVWEVSVDARRNSDAFPAAAPFTLTATILGASVSPNPDVIQSAKIGTPVNRSYTLTNLFGAFTGKAVGTNLGSAKRSVNSIANLAVQTFDVTIPAGATSLRATIGNPSDPAADLDLFVSDCTSGKCVDKGASADGDSEESVTISNPAAGLWRVRVEGFAVPAGTTNYDYIDVFFTGTPLGTINVTDANALRAPGSSWTVPATVTANTAPSAGRVLYGNVQVRTDADVLVGSGDVIVQNVTP
jgi:subtilase family protein/pre-peptidase